MDHARQTTAASWHPTAQSKVTEQVIDTGDAPLLVRGDDQFRIARLGKGKATAG